MQTDKTPNPDALPFSELLKTAVTEPGIIAACYSAFHNYSLGNQILAFLQCRRRGIKLGPISTFQGWKNHRRFVMKGQKALTLCMPITLKSKAEGPDDQDEVFTRFVYRNRWFVLAQTDGQPFTAPTLPDFDLDRALIQLDITRTDFDLMDGNCQGYAIDRRIAINPVAAEPMKTTFHEMAHILHGHTKESMLSDSERTPRNIREVEAEAVAMLCCAALGLPGLEYSRGYIQHWYQGNEIPEASARKILKVADQILRAGRPACAKAENQE